MSDQKRESPAAAANGSEAQKDQLTCVIDKTNNNDRVAQQAKSLTEKLGGRWRPERNVGLGIECPVCQRLSLAIEVGERSIIVRCSRFCDRRAILACLRKRHLLCDEVAR